MKTSLGKFPLAIVALALTVNLQLPTALAGPAVTSIAGGFQHSLFSKSDGSLWVMGDNGYGELGIGFTPAQTNLPVQVLSSGVQKVAAGALHSLYLVGGSLWVMGHNDYGQLGDGTINNHFFPEKIFTASFSLRVNVMAGGHYHSLYGTYSPNFIGNDDLYAMGANGAGELGDGTFTVHYSAEQVRSSTLISAVTAGEGHSLYLKSDGSLWAMGFNRYGQLGDNSIGDKFTPEQIAFNGVTAVAAGEGHSLFIESDGSLWGMGLNDSGQLGTGDYATRYAPVLIVPGPPPPPLITGISLSGPNLILTGANGVSGEI